ncbi:hypothetical protein KY346_00460 [Candidatus Woesearchaeota archaeon]|nr:hypothetical protein [Candidatus Woesearchaeota archaeon]
MKLKKRLQRMLKRLPYIGKLNIQLAEQIRLNKNSERLIIQMMRERTELKNRTDTLEKRLTDFEYDKTAFQKTVERKKLEIINLNRNIAKKHDELRKAEIALADERQEADEREFFEAVHAQDLQERYEKAHQRLDDMMELEKYRLAQHENHKAKYVQLKSKAIAIEEEKDALQKEVSALKKVAEDHDRFKQLFGSNVKGFEEVYHAWKKEERRSARLKHRAEIAFTAAKAYKHGPVAFIDRDLPRIVDHFGYSLLLLKENGDIYHVTPAAAQQLGKKKEALLGKNFSNVFDCSSIDWLVDIGPEYPLGVKDTSEEICAMIEEIPGGITPENPNEMRIIYAISLRREEKQGPIEKRRTRRLAAPYAITERYKQDIASAMSAATQKTDKNVYIDLWETNIIEPAFIEWAEKINAGKSEGKIYFCYPSSEVSKQLSLYDMPEEYITQRKQKKKKLSGPRTIWEGLLSIKFAPAT